MVPPSLHQPMSTQSSPEILEAIGLSVAFDALRDLVNRELMIFRPLADYPGEMQVVFQSRSHCDLFYIRLLDFVHEGGSKELLGEKMSCLEVLERAGAHARLSDQGSVNELAKAAANLRSWLDEVIHPKFWLGNIDVNVRLSVTRLQLLKIAGNQAKHNLARLTGISQQVQTLLAQHGHQVPLAQIPFALDDFRGHLGANAFVYYGSWLAELINDVTWALYRYIEPIYHRQVVFIDGDLPGTYKFLPLPGVDPGSPEHWWFHRLLNEVRVRPYVPPFKASRYLKLQSSLEWEDEDPAAP